MTEGLFLKIIENLINSVELRFLTIWSSSAKTKFSQDIQISTAKTRALPGLKYQFQGHAKKNKNLELVRL